jgi:hypothetical protein
MRQRIKLDKDGKIKLSETQIKKQIKSYLKQIGVRYWWHLSGVGCYPNLPDIEGSYQGKHFFIETKIPTGRLSFGQAEFLKWASDEGYYCCVPHSFDEFLEWWEKECGNKLMYRGEWHI